MGKAAIRGCGFSRIIKANTGYVEKKNTDGQSLPRVGKVASKASRIGFWRYEKERRKSSQVRRLREYPIHRCAVPLSQWGRLRYEDTAFLDTMPFPRGKAKRRRLRSQKRKPTPPRCARQPLPREGARVDTPSFLWKEVPRRGGGWMGMPLSPKHSLPRERRCAVSISHSQISIYP